MDVQQGRCHCGNVTADLILSQPVEDVPLRACTCSFCLRHGARYFSDPAGRVNFRIGSAGVAYYRFGTATCDFIICKQCGVLVGAVSTTEAGLIAVVNAAGLGLKAMLDGKNAAAVSFDGETLTERLTRRSARWMPAEIDSGYS